MSVTTRSNASVIRARLRGELTTRTRDHATSFKNVVSQKHLTAPRGGENLNKYGQPRSAPGEPPAPETGELYNRINAGPEQTGPTEFRQASNYLVLETGYAVGNRSRLSDKRTLGARQMAPRPLAQLSIAEYKARVG